MESKTDSQGTDKSAKPTGEALLAAATLLAFFVPEHLAEDFDHFVVMGITALDGMGDRKDWSANERAIVEWMESEQYKANDQGQLRREDKE